MSNPLMQGGGKWQTAQPQMTPQQALQQIKANPVSMIKQAGYNVPDNIANDPNAMIQHLVQSGQVPQSRLQSILQRFGRR